MTGLAATILLCDADGTLFPSEEPAYEASAEVTNRFLAEVGAHRAYSPAQLMGMTNGKNFRAAAGQLAEGYSYELAPTDLDRWVGEEKDVVTAHLRTVLRPDPEVRDPLRALGERFALAAVTSSARSRLDACLEVTGLAPLFEPSRRYSAEDSLPVPTSKPDPAVYAFALQDLGTTPDQAVAIEDSLNGAMSATSAGLRTLGIVAFVAPADRADRAAGLREAGCVEVVASWTELAALLGGTPMVTGSPR